MNRSNRRFGLVSMQFSSARSLRKPPRLNDTRGTHSFVWRRRSSRRSGLVDTGGSRLSLSTMSEQNWPPLLTLAKHARWQRVFEILEQHNAPDLIAWMDDCSGDCGLQNFKGETMLHLIMEYRPPADIIELWIRRKREWDPTKFPQDAIDMRGQNPLFCAVRHGCHVDVVKLLLHGAARGGPVGTLDATLRLALHWACCNSSNPEPSAWTWKRCGHNSRLVDNMILVVEVLVRAGPRTIWCKDQDGRTPYDVAVHCNAHPHILFILEIAMQSSPQQGELLTKKGQKWEHSNSGTADSSRMDVPLEVMNTTSSSSSGDSDDVSSIGSGGVSTMYCKKRRWRQRPVCQAPAYPAYPS